jgi:hypothetical protein
MIEKMRTSLQAPKSPMMPVACAIYGWMYRRPHVGLSSLRHQRVGGRGHLQNLLQIFGHPRVGGGLGVAALGVQF